MSTVDAKTRTELEDAAAAVIGQLVLALSRLEFNLGLYLRNAVGGADPEAANPLVGRLSFKSKLEALQEVVEYKFAAEPEASQELAPWLKAMGAFRSRRNSFVHGRWGFLIHSQQIVNVAPGLPSGKPVRQVHYSVAELQRTLDELNRLSVAFGHWSGRWPV